MGDPSVCAWRVTTAGYNHMIVQYNGGHVNTPLKIPRPSSLDNESMNALISAPALRVLRFVFPKFCPNFVSAFATPTMAYSMFLVTLSTNRRHDRNHALVVVVLV
jgi:hypothetical protein